MSIRDLRATIQLCVFESLLLSPAMQALTYPRERDVKYNTSSAYLSSKNSSWLHAFTNATSRSGAFAPATFAMLMLVWSFTTPNACRILLGAIDCDCHQHNTYKAHLQKKKRNGEDLSYHSRRKAPNSTNLQKLKARDWFCNAIGKAF